MKVFCVSCGEYVPFKTIDLGTHFDRGRDKCYWNDVLCSQCGVIIITIESSSPGTLMFVEAK